MLAWCRGFVHFFFYAAVQKSNDLASLLRSAQLPSKISWVGKESSAATPIFSGRKCHFGEKEKLQANRLEPSECVTCSRPHC